MAASHGDGTRESAIRVVTGRAVVRRDELRRGWWSRLGGARNTCRRGRVPVRPQVKHMLWIRSQHGNDGERASLDGTVVRVSSSTSSPVKSRRAGGGLRRGLALPTV